MFQPTQIEIEYLKNIKYIRFICKQTFKELSIDNNYNNWIEDSFTIIDINGNNFYKYFGPEISFFIGLGYNMELSAELIKKFYISEYKRINVKCKVK